MKKAVLYAIAGVFALSLGAGMTSSPVFAQAPAKKLTMADCKKMTDTKAKNDCTKQVKAQAKKTKAAKKTTKKTTKKKVAPAK